jgi:hypothetical protein
MASGTGLTSGPSPEEVRAQDIKDQEEWAKNHEVLNIKGGMHNTSRAENIGSNVETYTLGNGRRGFQGSDGTTYYLNEDNGRWESSTRAADYYNLGSVASPAAPGVEGAGLIAAANPNKDYMPTPTPGTEDAGPVGTPEITGGYEQMIDWRPISSDGSGGIQQMNSLVDPGNWVNQINPQWQAINDPGIYVNPNLPQGMLQDDEEIVQMSSNPYSLLG